MKVQCSHKNKRGLLSVKYVVKNFWGSETIEKRLLRSYTKAFELEAFCDRFRPTSKFLYCFIRYSGAGDAALNCTAHCIDPVEVRT